MGLKKCPKCKEKAWKCKDEKLVYNPYVGAYVTYQRYVHPWYIYGREVSCYVRKD